MKLYLSSQKLGLFPNMLKNLVGDNLNVVVIANALDDQTEEYRNDRVKKEFQMLKLVGLNPEELDLRDYFGKGEQLRKYLKTKSLIWIRGGNTFILSRAINASGFDKEILPLIKDGTIAYGGYSASLLLASKDLLGTEIVDDPYSVPNGYPKSDCNFESLHLLDFYLIPHFNNTDEWAKNIRKHVEYLLNNKKKVVTLNDGEVYYCNGKKGKILK